MDKQFRDKNIFLRLLERHGSRISHSRKAKNNKYFNFNMNAMFNKIVLFFCKNII